MSTPLPPRPKENDSLDIATRINSYRIVCITEDGHPTSRRQVFRTVKEHMTKTIENGERSISLDLVKPLTDLVKEQMCRYKTGENDVAIEEILSGASLLEITSCPLDSYFYEFIFKAMKKKSLEDWNPWMPCIIHERTMNVCTVFKQCGFTFDWGEEGTANWYKNRTGVKKMLEFFGEEDANKLPVISLDICYGDEANNRL